MANFFKASKNKAPNMAMVTIEVARLDSNGCGVGRLQNKPVFVQGALPGEKVDVKVLEQKNKYIRAKLLDIVKSSEDRTEPKCQHFGSCGGCDLQMLSFKKQLPFKQQKVTDLFSRHFSKPNLPWQEPIYSQPWQYRRKARLGVQFNKKAEATIGFRQKSTNQLTPIKSCSVLVEPLSDIFKHLKELLTTLTVKSAIGHIEVIYADIVDRQENITLVVRQLKPLNDNDIKTWTAYASQHHWRVIIDEGSQQHNIVDMQPDIKQVVTKTLDQLSYSIPNPQNKLKGSNAGESSEITVHFTSQDFIQINHPVNLTMIEQAISWLNIKSSDNVLDLFCGLGNFSLAMATLAGQVIGVEGVQAMTDKAKLNAEFNNIDNCQFYQADLNDSWLHHSWAKHVFDKVLLDPARAGAEKAVQQIATLKVPTILYVSCDPATLARDSEILVSKGYFLEKISLIDMFSQTKHIETMVMFTRKN
jgi:23S rRNA (uracil1939-C5)-methyltransferase